MRRVWFLLWLVLVVSSAQAEPGDFENLLGAVRQQFERSGIPEGQRDPDCWLEADAMLDKVALESLFSDPALGQLDIDAKLGQVRQAIDGPFARLDTLLLVQAFDQAAGNRARFLKLVMRLPWGKDVPDWKSKAVKAQVDGLFTNLSSLQWEDVEVSFSSRYEKATWAFNVTAAYFPLRRRVRVYVLGSSRCPVSGRSKTLALNLKGLTEVEIRDGARKFSVTLQETSFKCRGCELELKGSWTDRFTAASGQAVAFKNRLFMTVKGSNVSGRLIADVTSTDANGKVTGGRIIFRVAGRLDMEGELEANLTGDVNRRALVWMDQVPELLKGSLKGSVQDGSAHGEMSINGVSNAFRWNAEVAK